MALDKQQQFELAKIELGNQRTGNILEFVKTFGWMGCILGLAYLMFNSLNTMVLANPAGISAIAGVVKSLGLGSKLSYLLAAATSSAWFLERKGKKRLLSEVAEGRRIREAKDPYRARSALTSSGDTPKKKRGT